MRLLEKFGAVRKSRQAPLGRDSSCTEQLFQLEPAFGIQKTATSPERLAWRDGEKHTRERKAANNRSAVTAPRRLETGGSHSRHWRRRKLAGRRSEGGAAGPSREVAGERDVRESFMRAVVRLGFWKRTAMTKRLLSSWMGPSVVLKAIH